jgi:hypothetical protein
MRAHLMPAKLACERHHAWPGAGRSAVSVPEHYKDGAFHASAEQVFDRASY